MILRNQFRQPMYNLAGRYDNPIPTWFLAPILSKNSSTVLCVVSEVGFLRRVLNDSLRTRLSCGLMIRLLAYPFPPLSLQQLFSLHQSSCMRRSSLRRLNSERIYLRFEWWKQVFVKRDSGIYVTDLQREIYKPVLKLDFSTHGIMEPLSEFWTLPGEGGKVGEVPTNTTARKPSLL